jgi:polysaccharide pyruvyl transferase WcaK-like protein
MTSRADVEASGMRILIDSGAYDCRNMGDMSMLKVAVRRLHQLWPDASLHVLTAAPEALSMHCPEAVPTPVAAREMWFAERSLLGQLHSHMPAGVSRGFVAGKRWLRRSAPGVLSAMVDARGRLTGAGSARAFSRSLAGADLIVFSGQASFNDLAEAHSRTGLELLADAVHRGTPTALLAQGLGPLAAPSLVRLARRVLPRVCFISIRERRTALPLLASLGVDTDGVPVTGDDAIELAYGLRVAETGSAIGVNVRISGSAALPGSVLMSMRSALHELGRSVAAELIAVPIVHRREGTDDARHIAPLLEGYRVGDAVPDLDTPEAVIAAVGRCRLVVTGAYHAAVFALSQGIPAVCLPTNAYTGNKFDGLAGQFPGGVQIVPLNAPGLSASLRAALSSAWEAAPDLRASLLDAATRQITAAQDAYALLYERVATREKAA